MSINKKLVSAVLTATTISWAVGIAALPLAQAQTTTSLQSQIAALLAQIQQLQGQLNSSGTPAMATTSYAFTKNLTVGSKGADVTALQQILINGGYLTAVSAPTGYFGSATQKALAAFQAAKGITPSAGYFGPKTMAYLASNGTTTTTTTTTTTGGTTTTTTTGTGTTVVAPATGMSVSLASTNPAAGSLISSASAGSSRVPVLAVSFTAGTAGPVTLSSVSFQKTGVLSDSAVAGAYLTQNGQVLAQYNSLNSGLLSFSGLNLSIPAGQTVTLTLAIDVSANLSAGNTTGFALESASAISAFDSNNAAVTPAGSFPLTGSTFTVTSVTNPSLAYVTIASSSIGTTVTAGTQGNIVGSWNFTVNNSPVYLQNLNFHVIGSANVTNIQNVKLMVNGTQVGQTLSSVPASGLADFSATGSAIKLNTGSNNVQVVADVTGSPSDYFQFEILNGYDVLAIDSQYNVPISVTNNGGVGTQVAIQVGQITINQDANTPTGNIAKGQSAVVLAKYDIYAAGEPVKVKFLDFNIVLGGASGQALSNEIQNVAITDDAGNQVGTSINQPPSSNVCQATNAVASYNTVSDTYSDCFGTPSSPINYIVPANTTRILSLKADIQTGSSFNTITANLSGDTGNLQGMTSSQIGNTAGATGVSLTLVSSSLSVSQNNALGTQSVSAGTTNLKIGSYAFSASSAEGVNVNTVTVKLTPDSTLSAFQNLKLFVNGTQFGTTQGVLSGETNYAFSGTAFNVPAGQTVNVDVYADTLSAATGTYTPATSLVGYSGTGATSFTSVNIPANTTYTGQTVNFSGQPAITIAADSSNPPAGIIVQNTSGNTLAVFRFTETSNVENVKVTQLNVLDKVQTTSLLGNGQSKTLAAFSNVSLWNGSQELGTAASPVWDASNGGYDYNFNSFTNALVVPQGNSVSLTLKGDAGSYTNGSLSDNTTSTFEIVQTGAGSNYVAATAASSTLTVNMPSLLAAGNYSYYVTVNGITSPAQTFTAAGVSSTTDATTLASDIVTTLTGNLSAFGLTGATISSSGNVVTIVSTHTASLGASAALWGASTVSIAAVNNAGAAGSGTATTQNVIARGATSNKTANVALSNATGNPQTTLRTLLGVAATPVTTLPPASFSQIGSLTFTANSSGDAELNNLTLTFNTTSTAFMNTVALHDPSGNDIYTVDHFATSTVATSTTTATGTITWVFATSTNPLDVTAGSSYTLSIWGNLATIPTVASQGLSLTATIVNNTDFGYLDGSSGTPALINLTTSQANTLTPVNLQSGAGLPL